MDMATHTACGQRDLRVRRCIEVAFRARFNQILQRSREGVALAKVIGFGQCSEPRGIAHGERQRVAFTIEHRPVAGHDGTEDRLRVREFRSHDAAERRRRLIR